jgi:hypothetical protein
VDSAEATAGEVAALFASGAVRAGPTAGGTMSLYVTDVPDRIPELSSRFLGERVEHAEQVDI